jgi:3-oxoacyl-[acyl-carrier protein] reductase
VGAERTAERVREAGAEAELIQGDITKWDDIKRMAEHAFGEFGGLDVLINNVGDMASGQASWTEVTEEAIDHVLAVDIKGTMLMIHEFGQRMDDRDGGAIVNVGSTVIVRGSPRAPQYAAGKYGLLGVTKSYAKALAPKVRINIFAPGFMETEAVLARPEWKTGRRELILSGTPAGKIPKPEDMTGACLFLASEDAHHITGSYMIADGGYSMLGA